MRTLLMLSLIASVPVLAFPKEQAGFEVLFRQGLELAAQGEDIEALQTLQAAARLSPRNANLQFNIGGLSERLGRAAEAIVAYRLATEIAPDEASFQYALGYALFRAGRSEDALPALQRSAEAPEPIPQALVILAGAYEALGKPDESLAPLRKYVEMRPDDVETRALLGQHLAAAKRLDEAVELWKGGLSADNPSSTLLFRIGEALSREGETYAEAELYLRRALEAEPNRLEARLVLARILDRTDREEEALQELQQAAQNHRDASQAYYQLATLYQRLGRMEEAQAAGSRFQELSAVEKRREQEQARIPVTYKRAMDLLQQGKMLEAEAEFESVLELDADNAQTRSMLAKIAFSKGDVGGARRWIAEAIEKDASVGEYHYLSALLDVRVGNSGDAEAAVRRSLELTPGFPDAWVLLGTILADTDRTAEAVDCYLKAAALEPSNPTIQLNLASAYAALGRSREENRAMELYRKLSKER